MNTFAIRCISASLVIYTSVIFYVFHTSTFPFERCLADGTAERFFLCVTSHVTLQAVGLTEASAADRTAERLLSGVDFFVLRQIGFPLEGRFADGAAERSVLCVKPCVLRQSHFQTERFATDGAAVGFLRSVMRHVIA